MLGQCGIADQGSAEMNFAEELAFWYLRLNGFFPITNFVLHRFGERAYTADTDLLAVRFPYVSEDIGGNPDDWDPIFREQWDLPLSDRTIGLIVEVKSGRWDPADLARMENTDRLRDAVRRLGMVPKRRLNMIVGGLAKRSKVFVGKRRVIAKLLVAPRVVDAARWLHLPLSEAESFILRRFANYHPEKHADRQFFASELIQYLAWKAART